MLQLKNRAIRLQDISYAEIVFPDENTENGCIELYLIVGGQQIVTMGDDALILWQAISKNAVSLLPPEWNDPDRLPPLNDAAIAASTVPNTQR
jgi:hypothetical protein